MSVKTRWAILFFFTPIFFGLIYTAYYRASRDAFMKRLSQSGVVALFDGGMVAKEDIQLYFLTPPLYESPILTALELTPEDVNGLDREDPVWLQSPTGQFLIGRIVQHISLIRYLNLRWLANSMNDDGKEVEEYRHTLMMECMEQDLAKITPDVPQKEILAYYVAHPDDFRRDGKRLTRHLMIENDDPPDPSDPSKTTPRNILTRLESGEDFFDLIRQESRSESVDKGGILGWHAKGAFHEAFDRALWSLEIGEVTGPIRVGESLHFIQALDEEPEGLIPFDECKEAIREKLVEDKRKVHRFKLLGLSSEGLSPALRNVDGSSPESVSNEDYRKALLQAAYAREWDKNVDVVRKTNAFARYRHADLLFRIEMKQFQDSPHHTAKSLLERIHFRYLVKMDTISPGA
ncbi:MAG: peptidylprolyl isomerase [Candidatus Omnitrophota bacterium]